MTKSYLLTRDLDFLDELAGSQAAMELPVITTLDAELGRKLEPRASIPERRLAAIERIAASRLPVDVLAAPVIPGLNDHEVISIQKVKNYQSDQSHAWRTVERSTLWLEDAG